RRSAGAAQGAPGDRARAEDARAGLRNASFGLRRLSEDLAVTAGIKASLWAYAHVDAAACAHLRARSRGRTVRAHLEAARLACGRNARRRARRLHAAPAGDVDRRARRVDRVVQHDVGAAPGSASEDRGIAARDG